MTTVLDTLSKDYVVNDGPEHLLESAATGQPDVHRDEKDTLLEHLSMKYQRMRFTPRFCMPFCKKGYVSNSCNT